MKTTEEPLKIGELTKEQTEHMRAVYFNLLGEDQIKESKLAELAAMGFTQRFKDAMAADTDVHPGLAVTWAAESQRTDCLNLALERFSKNDHHHMAANMAVLNGNNDILKLVLGTPTQPELSDLIRWACKIGNVGALNVALPMLDQGSLGLHEPTLDPSGYGAMSALEWSIAEGHADCMDALIKAGWRHDNGAESLMLAVRSESADCAERIVLQIEDGSELGAAFSKACELGHLSVAQVIRRALPSNFDSTEALWKCAEFDEPECVALAALGAKLDVVDDDGLTLIEAVLERELNDPEGVEPTEMIEELMKVGAPLPRLTSSGADMIKLCRERDWLDLADLLSEERASRERAVLNDHARVGSQNNKKARM